MTPDELKTMPKGAFIVMKTGVHPMQVRLRLFLDWGIRFNTPYEVPEKAQRPVAYASREELEEAIFFGNSSGSGMASWPEQRPNRSPEEKKLPPDPVQGRVKT